MGVFTSYIYSVCVGIVDNYTEHFPSFHCQIGDQGKPAWIFYHILRINESSFTEAAAYHLLGV